jgi:hypothetical protein
MKGLKLTERGQLVAEILRGLGTVAVLAFFVLSMWALAAVLLP